MSVITGVVDVAFKRAAPDEEIAYDGRVAVGESELMKVLLDGIARETVAYGQYAQGAGRQAEHRCDGEKDEC